MSESQLQSEGIPSPVLAVRDLGFRYGPEYLFDAVGFDLYAGETVLLSGASGSGKSTLLRVLARLQSAERGTIHLSGTSADSIPAPEYRKRVAYLQQLPVMLTGSVQDNLTLSFRFSGDPPPADELMQSMMHRAGLDDIPLGHSARELSIGQQQRIALLRLLFMQPDVILLDEPTASLDSAAAGILLALLTLEQEQGGFAALLVSHGGLEHMPARRRQAELRDRTLVEVPA